MKKTVLIIILAIILVIVFVYFYFLKEKGSVWQTYQNARYNFSLEYPPGWQLGEPETNNAGREFFSPDRKTQCYAYGFQNAIITEDNDTQTLKEFIDWLYGEQNIKVIEEKETVLGGHKAFEVISEENGKIKDAVYVLGQDTGRGLFCIFESQEARDKFQQTFDKMIESFKIEVSLDEGGEGDIYTRSWEGCENLLSGVVTPLKDLQTFLDENYTEVTGTSREYWDKERLPEKVLELQKKDYFCCPMPFEHEEPQEVPGIHIMPEVKKVQWTCELEYTDWQYVESRDLDKKVSLEKQGYTCEEKSCLDAEGNQSFVWLCTR